MNKYQCTARMHGDNSSWTHSLIIDAKDALEARAAAESTFVDYSGNVFVREVREIEIPINKNDAYFVLYDKDFDGFIDIVSVHVGDVDITDHVNNDVFREDIAIILRAQSL